MTRNAAGSWVLVPPHDRRQLVTVGNSWPSRSWRPGNRPRSQTRRPRRSPN